MSEIEDIPQGSLEEAFIINSPDNENRNQEDIFLSRYSFQSLCGGNIDEYFNKNATKNAPIQFPSWNSIIEPKYKDIISIKPFPVIDEVINFDYYNKEVPPKESVPISLKKKGKLVDSFGFIYDNEEEYQIFSKYLENCNLLKGKNSKMEEQTLQILKYDWSSNSKEKRKKLKQRIRKGIPSRHRGEIWKNSALFSLLHDESLLLFVFFSSSFIYFHFI